MADKNDKTEKQALIRAAYAPDEAAAEQMCAVLSQVGINAVRQGGTRDIYRPANGAMGIEIMVPEDRLEQAVLILKQMAGQTSDTSKPPVSVRKTVLYLLAAGVLLVILLMIRGFIL